MCDESVVTDDVSTSWALGLHTSVAPATFNWICHPCGHSLSVVCFHTLEFLALFSLGPASKGSVSYG